MKACPAPSPVLNPAAGGAIGGAECGAWRFYLRFSLFDLCVLGVLAVSFYQPQVLGPQFRAPCALRERQTASGGLYSGIMMLMPYRPAIPPATGLGAEIFFNREIYAYRRGVPLKWGILTGFCMDFRVSSLPRQAALLQQPIIFDSSIFTLQFSIFNCQSTIP